MDNNLFTQQNEDPNELPDKKTLYKEEIENLLKSRKKELSSDIYGIINNLKQKKDIQEFIEANIDYLDNQRIFFSGINSNMNKKVIFFVVKIIGFCFLTCYLIGIFQLIGIKESLEEEALESIKFYFTGSKSNYTVDFYHKIYSNCTKKLPSLSLFFILSFLSGIVVKLINFPLITIIMLALNGIIFYFLYNFEFLEEKKLKEENYSFFNFFLLILYVLYFNLILGIVALLPVNIFSSGYFYYESYLINQNNSLNDNLKNSSINGNIINNSFSSNRISDDDMNIGINDKINKNNDMNTKKYIKNISITRFTYGKDKIIENPKKENISDIYIRDSSSFFLEVNI